jgi:hypothetical protein
MTAIGEIRPVFDEAAEAAGAHLRPNGIEIIGAHLF